MIRVLYLHGFEENPGSPKPQALLNDKRFDVRMPSLNVHFKQSRSPLIFALMQRWLLGSIACGMGVGIGAATYASFTPPFASVCGLMATSTLLYSYRKRLVSDAVSGSYLCSLEVAKSALLEHKPHVVVGFSWGGALACDMINSAEWTGPTVLLAPAHRKLLELRGLASSRVRLPCNTVVVHSQADSIVPIEWSRELVAGQEVSNVRLLEIKKDPHKMWSIATDGTMARLVQEAGFQAALTDKTGTDARGM